MNSPSASPEARPWPQVNAATAGFWESGAEGVLRLHRCLDCSRFHHPPSPLCPHCLGQQLAFVAVSGWARVATFTVNHHAWHPAFPPPYVLAIVEPEDAPGVRLTTRLCRVKQDAVHIGLRVRVCFQRVGPAWLPLFAAEEN